MTENQLRSNVVSVMKGWLGWSEALKYGQEALPQHLFQLFFALLTRHEAGGAYLGPGGKFLRIICTDLFRDVVGKNQRYLHAFLEIAGDAAGVYQQKRCHTNEQEHQTDADYA